MRLKNEGFRFIEAGVWASSRKGGIVITRQRNGKWLGAGHRTGQIRGTTLKAVIAKANKR